MAHERVSSWGAVGATALVRLPHRQPGVDHECAVVWTDPDVGVALLRVTAPQWVAPAGLPPLRRGQLVTAQVGLPAQVAGIPDRTSAIRARLSTSPIPHLPACPAGIAVRASAAVLMSCAVSLGWETIAR
jgi:hypothetical protein